MSSWCLGPRSLNLHPKLSKYVRLGLSYCLPKLPFLLPPKTLDTHSTWSALASSTSLQNARYQPPPRLAAPWPLSMWRCVYLDDHTTSWLISRAPSNSLNLGFDLFPLIHHFRHPLGVIP